MDADTAGDLHALTPGYKEYAEHVRRDEYFTELAIGETVDQYRCEHCGFARANVFACKPPHYAQIRCRECNTFIRWMPKPENRNGRGPELSASTKYEVLQEGQYTCAECGRSCHELEAHECLNVDHIAPKAKNGTNERSNLQCLCSTCNQRKSDKVPEVT